MKWIVALVCFFLGSLDGHKHFNPFQKIIIDWYKGLIFLQTEKYCTWRFPIKKEYNN